MNLVSKEINEYCEAHATVPSEHCREIEDYTRDHVPMPVMLSGPLVGSLLGLLARSLGAKRVLEVGTFTGYAALALAERLPDDARVITLDRNPKTMELARCFWNKSPHGRKIEGVLGDALQTLKTLPGPFDFVFLDAEKTEYSRYLDLVLGKLSPQGMIAVDNCLWSGRVLDAHTTDLDTRAIREFNARVARDPRLEKTLLPVRDGILLIRKL